MNPAMDPVTLGYYATVCGLLGALAPGLGNFLLRLVIGILVGLGAAAALPAVRGMIGY